MKALRHDITGSVLVCNASPFVAPECFTLRIPRMFHHPSPPNGSIGGKVALLLGFEPPGTALRHCGETKQQLDTGLGAVYLREKTEPLAGLCFVLSVSLT